jgi:hypothetical protein
MADSFRLTKAVTGITFNPEGRGFLTTLPIDARLVITGQSRLPGFIEVTCGVSLLHLQGGSDREIDNDANDGYRRVG